MQSLYQLRLQHSCRRMPHESAQQAMVNTHVPFHKLGMLLRQTVGSVPLHMMVQYEVQLQNWRIAVQSFSTESTFSTPAGYTPYNINYKVTCNS